MPTTPTFWLAEDLGRPIPADPHAVSVCLPRWQDNIGYEENEPAVIEAMRCGYPRFFLHPSVVALFDECQRQAGQTRECAFAFPSRRVAERCVSFLEAQAIPARSVECFDGQACAVFLPEEHRLEAKAYWQHSGEVIGSRQAEAILSESENATRIPEGESAKTIIKQRVAQMHGCSTNDVWLFPSGMAAIFFSYRLFQLLRPDSRSVQFGFPYVDILKVQERFANPSAPNVAFYPRGSEEDLADVESIAKSEELQGLYVEIPGNPLLTSPNIRHLSHLAQQYNFPLMIDDTLAACCNLDTFPHADIVCTSLTKYFSGAGNVLAGSLVLNPDSRFAEPLRRLLESEYEDLFYGDDAIVLEKNSRDFEERVPRINSNALKLVEFLQSHADVEHVYYPSLSTSANYPDLMRTDGGYGGLLSFVLTNPAHTTPQCLDALMIPKGPNLGTSFTLCCPYTILAHYNELEFVESLDVSRYLIRVSVGLEDSDWIIDRFRTALLASQKD